MCGDLVLLGLMASLVIYWVYKLISEDPDQDK
jgi:hypothetical protein